MKPKNILSILTALIAVTGTTLCAQPVQQWSKTFNGTANSLDKTVAVKYHGCDIYVTGVSQNSGTGLDYLTIKYNSAGDTLWTRRYTNTAVPGGDDSPADMVVDASGNVYVTGKSQGSGTGYDFLTVKYNAAGTQQWVSRFNNAASNSDDVAVALVLDVAQTNVFTGGHSLHYVNSTSNNDLVIIKYDAATGSEVWSNPAGYSFSSYDDIMTCLAISNTGYLYAGGNNSYNGGTIYSELVRFNSSGVQDQYAYPSGNNTTDVTVDGTGNVYMVSYDTYNKFYVYKYGPNLNIGYIWYSSFSVSSLGLNLGNGQFNCTKGYVKVNSSGVYAATALDIDPATNSTNYDVWVTKLTIADGDTLWTKRWGGTKDDTPTALTLDAAGNAFVTGTATTGTNKNILVNEYDANNGSLLWNTTFNGTSNSADEGSSIAVTPQSNILVSGYTTTSNAQDFITLKYAGGSAPVATAYNGGHTATICLGTSLQLGTTNAGYTYQWGPSTNLSCSSCANPVASPVVNTTYKLTVTDVASCNSSTDSVIITVKPLPQATAGSNSPLCEGATVNLTGSATSGQAPYNFSWAGPASFSSASQNPSRPNSTPNMAGNYSVTVSDANGCTGSASANVTVNPNPIATITPSGNTSFCSGDSVTLCAASGFSYYWNTNATSLCITAKQNGNYSVTVTNNSTNCSAASTAVTVTVNSIPPVPAITAGGTTTFCEGGTVTLSAPAGYTYLWSNNATTQNITVNQSGNYSVTVSNGNCANNSAPTTVTVNPPATFDFDQYLCAGSTYTFNGQTLSVSGNYVQTIAGAAPNGCDSIITLHLHVQQLSQKTINASVCLQAAYNFNGTLIDSAGTYTDTLQNFMGCDSVVITLHLQKVTAVVSSVAASVCVGEVYNFNGVNISAAGTYTDTLTALGGCDSIVTLTLTVNSLPAQPSILANGNLLSSSPVSGCTYRWYFNGNVVSTSQTINTDTIGSGFYYVEAVNAFGCSTASAAQFVGLEEINTVQQLLVYPNPNTGTFFIKLNTAADEKFTLRIFDLTGKLIAEQHEETTGGSFLKEISLSEVPKGLYTLQIIHRSGNTNRLIEIR